MRRVMQDDTIQVMAAAVIACDNMIAAIQRGDMDTAQCVAHTCRSALSAACDRVRSVAAFQGGDDLIGSRGLAAGIDAELRMIRRAGFRTNSTVDLPRLAPGIELLAFRLVRRLLRNAVEHSAGSAIGVTLEDEGDRLSAEVVDDGRGFDPAEALSEENTIVAGELACALVEVELAGGGLAIDSAPGCGTAVSFWLPLGAAG
jgi:signal transduction histidine kinase